MPLHVVTVHLNWGGGEKEETLWREKKRGEGEWGNGRWSGAGIRGGGGRKAESRNSPRTSWNKAT